jgi:hypothetical protein
MSGLFTSGNASDYLDPAGPPRVTIPVRQVVAVYDTNSSARVARDGLLAAGIPGGAVHLVERADPASAQPKSPEARRLAFWAAVKSLFTAPEDPSVYHLAADPDHALLILQPTAATDLRRAMQILRASHPFYVFPPLDEASAPVQG